MKEFLSIVLGVLIGIGLTLTVVYYQKPADVPQKPKETILHYHFLDKSMCKWPA